MVQMRDFFLQQVDCAIMCTVQTVSLLHYKIVKPIKVAFNSNTIADQSWLSFGAYKLSWEYKHHVQSYIDNRAPNSESGQEAGLHLAFCHLHPRVWPKHVYI